MQEEVTERLCDHPEVDRIPNPSPPAYEAMVNELLQDAREVLDERSLFVFRARLLSDKKLDEIGRMIGGRNRERVRQIFAKAVRYITDFRKHEDAIVEWRARKT